MVQLVQAGRRPWELAWEFEPSYESIRKWVQQADRDEGRTTVAGTGTLSGLLLLLR